MRVQLALLLVCGSMSAHIASAASSSGFLFTSTKTEEVPESARVSSDQVYARTWQVRADAMANATVIEGLLLKPDGVAFVSYAEDTSGSSDLLATIKVSGQELSRVDSVVVENDVMAPATTVHMHISDLRFERSSPMLYEVVLHKKRTLKRIRGHDTGSVVIEDNVLSTTTKEAVAAFPVPTSTTGAALKVEKTTRKRTDYWDIKTDAANASNSSTVLLGFDSRFTGASVYLSLHCLPTDSGAREGRIARVTASYYTSRVTRSNAESELSVTRGSDYDTLTLQVGTSSTTSKIDSVWVDLTTPPSVQVRLPNLAANVNVMDECTRSPDYDAGLGLDFQWLIGSVYIVDKDAALFATEAFFEAPHHSMQIEVKELTTASMALRSSAKDSQIHYFSTGATTSPQIAIAPNGGKVCLSSSNDLKVAFADPRASPLVSYPGRAGGNTFECKKREIPKRVPALYDSFWAAEEKNETAPKTATSSAVRVSASSVAHAVVVVIGLIAATVL